MLLVDDSSFNNDERYHRMMNRRKTIIRRRAQIKDRYSVRVFLLPRNLGRIGHQPLSLVEPKSLLNFDQLACDE